MTDWRRYFAAAVATTDPECMDMMVEEATRAVERRLRELSEIANTEESRKETEEILRASKKLAEIGDRFKRRMEKDGQDAVK